jgi:hypothetical protein
MQVWRRATIRSSRSATARRAGGIGPRHSAKLTAKEAAQRQARALVGGPYFVSAEIHLESDSAHRATSPRATDDIKSTDAFGRSTHAQDSTWPPSLDVTADSTNQSRACVGLNTGVAQIQCDKAP